MSFGQYLSYILLIIGGFLLGGVMFCRTIPLLLTGKDVCELHEDKNPGAANAFMSCGKVIGFICLFCDLLKGFLPVFLAIELLPTDNVLFAFTMVAPVLGHAVGVFNGFMGGKCIATSFGVVIASFGLTWIGVILAVLYIVLVVAFKIDHRVGSIVVFALFGVSSVAVGAFTGRLFVGIGFALISIVAIIKHLPKREKKSSAELSDEVTTESAL